MRKTSFILSILVVMLVVPSVCAHVPYFEHLDFSENRPFVVRKFVWQSKAIYSWLENDERNPCEDIDVYQIRVRMPVRLYVEVIVPVCGDYYEDFVPWFAVVGPGLPALDDDLPFDIPDEYGAVVMENVEPGESRDTFYEPFGGKSYYSGPVFNELVMTRGTYYVYCWDPYQQGGDYVCVIGRGEFWGPLDIMRALIYTPMIRMDLELHVDCPDDTSTQLVHHNSFSSGIILHQ